VPKVDPRSASLPLFPPESSWKPPAEPPNLSSVRRLGVDTETRDPGLTTFGPGFLHGKANLVGVSLGTEDAKWYFPVAHPEDNCQWDVKAWLTDLLSADREYVGANLSYDVEALDHFGVRLGGKWLDVQIAEPLLDEERVGGYSLDSLSESYLGARKNEQALIDAAVSYGYDPKGDLWKLPARFVGAYAEDDAQLAIRILEKQLPLLEEQGLSPVFDLETRLLPIVWQMRKRGVRIDVAGAEALGRQWAARHEELLKLIHANSGMKVDIWSGRHLQQVCQSRGLTHPLTEKGNPSFSNDWLAAHEYPLFQLIAEARELASLPDQRPSARSVSYDAERRRRNTEWQVLE
jgi:DNA polymerase I-like protein with 3'-5' exonuclease and polymerase domains